MRWAKRLRTPIREKQKIHLAVGGNRSDPDCDYDSAPLARPSVELFMSQHLDGGRVGLANVTAFSRSVQSDSRIARIDVCGPAGAAR